jgi:hypothetical protein
MSDIFFDFCNICCKHINENENENERVYYDDYFEPYIFFSNETFFDILFNYNTNKYIVYYNIKHINIDTLKLLLFEKGFIFKTKFSVISKRNSFFVKDGNEIDFIECSILNTDFNPYKNVFLDIKTNNIIVKDDLGFKKIENLNDYFKENIDNCKELIKDQKERLFDFIYIFLRWNETTCFEIVNSVIDSYNEREHKIIKNNKLKNESILFFISNYEHTLNFLDKVGELKSEKIKLFAKLMETKFHIFNKIFYNTNQIRYYNCQISNMRIYMKFVVFAMCIALSEDKKNYFKNISFNEVNHVPHIKIPVYNLDSIHLDNVPRYSIIERLNKIDSIGDSSNNIGNIDFILKIKNANLKSSVLTFYQIAQAFFYIDEYKDDIETLKYAFICKKSQLLCYDDFCENIEILNSVCKRLGFKNYISDSNHIYEMNKRNIAYDYQMVCNKKIPQIIKSGNKMLDIYEYQKCYYLLLEELYLNKYGFGKSEYLNYQNEYVDEQIYEKIMEVLVKRIIEEKEEKKRYLKTGIKNVITTSIFDNCNFVVSESDSYSYSEKNSSNDVIDEEFDKAIYQINDLLKRKDKSEIDDDVKDIDNNYDFEDDGDGFIINSRDDFIIEPIFDNFFKSLVDNDMELDSPYGSPEINQHKSVSFDLINNEKNINEMNDDIDNDKFDLDKEYDLEILENNINELKNDNTNIKNKIKLTKLQMIRKLSEMQNFETKLLEGVDIDHMEDDKINEILDFYKLM